MKVIRHTTVNADNRIRKTGGGVVNVRNESNTTELTMGVRELKLLEQRFFIDIEDIIPDDLMGELLFHFRGEGLLLDEKGIRI